MGWRFQRVQERSLALEDREATRRLYRKQKELEAILDSDASEPEKAEAFRELDEIYQFQRQQGMRARDGARMAAHAVRQAINRLCSRLLNPLPNQADPSPVLHAFLSHLQKYTLAPSARYPRPTGSCARTGLAGCFTYEPPPGVYWQ